MANFFPESRIVRLRARIHAGGAHWSTRVASGESNVVLFYVSTQKLRLSVQRVGQSVECIELNCQVFPTQIPNILAETGIDLGALQIKAENHCSCRSRKLFADPEGTKGPKDWRRFGGFSTGYSSLSHIERYPIDVIKIDRPFISGMMHHECTVAIFKSIFSLGQALHAGHRGRGVEMESQLHRLKYGSRCAV